MIGIRSDVNRMIATGHIKRDIAIALCLRQYGEEPLFLSADESCLPYLEPYCFKSVILHTDWKDMTSETESMKAVIAENNITSLLVDSYQVTETYMKILTEWTKVTYFDELYRLGYGCQQLINGVLEPPDYSRFRGKALLGPDYVALRQEFMSLPPKRIRPRIEKVLVTTGGTDNYHFAVRFAETFLRQPAWEQVTLMVVVGEFCEDKEYLQEVYGQHHRLELYVNTKQMALLLQDADYAVTAGGTTLYEVCAVGVSASCYAIADNQLEAAKTFGEKGLVSYAGDFRENGEETFAGIFAQMDRSREAVCRREQAEKLQKLVDGKGAYRIAEALIGIQ